MKKILIIYPHFPPSNLAGVHRPRLFAQHLPEFGWEPVILTVHEKYYEEALDPNLVKLLPEGLRIEKVNALKVSKPRMVGDIGLRAFFQLYRKAKALIQKENFSFLYIPIPSFYVALLGRWLHSITGIPYGIDYIDPWVHEFPGSDRKFSRHWFSSKLAGILEPIAIKKAVLITGVAEGYYEGVLARNQSLKSQAIVGAMPYGGEKSDHVILQNLNIAPYLFSKKNDKMQLVYAGALLPKAFRPLEAVFKAIANNIGAFQDVEFIFIGTGKYANDDKNYSTKELAEKYGLWQTVIFEHPKRIPYLDVLSHLHLADGVFVLGSTEQHYTPSKIYQAVLSQRALFAVLHSESSGLKMIEDCNGGVVLGFNGEEELDKIEESFPGRFLKFKEFQLTYVPGIVNEKEFENYSAKSVTSKLAEMLDRIIKT